MQMLAEALPGDAISTRKLYFINEQVEWQLTQYIWTGCTRIALRDQIMSNATELIRQIIRKQGLHTIYPGQDDSSFGDLLNTAWCVVPDTMVFSNGLSKISGLIGPDTEGNCNFDIIGRYGSDVAEYYVKRPATRTYKISIKQHYNLEVTGEHPILTLTSDGPEWIPAYKLAPDDLIAIQAGQDCFGNNDVNITPLRKVTYDWWPDKISEDLAYVIGLTIAEGSIENQRIIIYNYDQSIIDYLSTTPAGLVFRYEGDGRNVCNRVGFVDFLTQLGLPPGTTCYTKYIPDKLLKCSRSVLVAMLRGMFDGDGHSSRYNGEVGYSSASIKLIDQLRLLLLNFGIITKTSIVERGVVIGPKGGKHIAATAYQLKMSSIESKKFYETIGFNIPYKQQKSCALTKKPFILLDTITTARIQTLLANYTKSTIVNACGSQRHLIKHKKRLTLEFAQKLVSGLSITDQFVLDRLDEATAQLRTIWLPITSIEHGWSETVDVRVHKHHNFTANGVIVSNCQIERTLYKYRGRPHCRACYNPERPGDSLLYEPECREYGIKTMEDIITINKVCPICNVKLLNKPMIEPMQGRYGGSETILYRGMSKVFNMWSQIARTVILAYIKKEARDRKNSGSYVVHLDNKPKPTSDIIIRFLDEARGMCQYHDDYLNILNALEWLIYNDDRPYDGIIGKLVTASGLSRPIITGFMRFVKLRSLEFTDSPMNKVDTDGKPDRRKMSNIDFDEE